MSKICFYFAIMGYWVQIHGMCTLWNDGSTGPSTTLIQTEISQSLLDGFAMKLIQTDQIPEN